jgi:hypothetical protein
MSDCSEGRGGAEIVRIAEVVVAIARASSPLFEPPPPQTTTDMQNIKSPSGKKNLLLCLDAFGTLFKPTKPIGALYAEVAARHGVPTGGSDGAREVGDRFKAAFKGETKRHPNYGKATGLGAEKWWANVSKPKPRSLAFEHHNM